MSVCILLFLPVYISAQSLLINEISQGISGNKEFAEFIVNGPIVTSCTAPTACVDLRGWIFDDNNGYFSGGTTTGTGIATGAMRFANDPFWSCVKPGTLILVYDVSETNISIPPQDLDPNDGNCMLVIPITSTLFDRHETRPIATNMTYSTTGWQSGGLWSLITMQNDNDSFQLRDPANLALPVHSVSWGNNTTNNDIYFAGSASGLAFACDNAVSDDFFLQSNWESRAASAQTPGAYNSTENQNTIGALNLNCGTTFNPQVSFSDVNCVGSCTSQAYITYSGGVTPYQAPQWSTGESTDTIKNLCAGPYSVIITDKLGCSVTVNFTVQASNPSTPISVSPDVSICAGETTVLQAFGISTVKWTPGNVKGATYSVTPTATTVYTVADTSGSCSTPSSVTVTVLPKPEIDFGTVISPTACSSATGSIEITGTETGDLSWSGAASGNLNGISFPQTISGLVSGSYTFTFTNAQGCVSDPISTAISDPGAPPKPTIAISGPTAICPGQSITLTSSALAGNEWSTGETTQSIVVLAAGTYSVTNESLGCTSISDPITISVNTPPVVNAGTDVTICTGQAVTLNGAGAISYTWDNGVSDGVAFNPLSTATYTVTGTGSNGCSDTDDVLITVNPLPNVGSGADQEICIGDAVTLTGSGALSYSWDNGVSDGVAFSPTSTQTYTVTGTDVNGCINTDQVVVSIKSTVPLNGGADRTVCAGTSITLAASGASAYVWDNGVTDGVAFVPLSTTTYTVSVIAGGCLNTDEVLVTVNPIPTVDAGNDQEVCEGGPVTLAATGALLYNWDQGVADGVEFPAVSGSTYTVVGIDINGCSAQDQVSVTVNPLPLVDAGTDLSVCSGTTVTLAASGAITYVWDNNVTDGISFQVFASTTYTVIGIDGNGCQNSDQMQISITATLPLDAGADQSICEGESVILAASGASGYVWDNGVTDGQAFFPVVTQTYQVSATDGSGCTNTDVVTVTVNPLPVVDAGNDQSACGGASIVLSGNGALTYVWDNGVQDGVAFTPLSDQTYIVTGTDGNGCTETDQVFVGVFQSPIVSAGNDVVLCEGESVILSGSGAQSYQWDFGVVDGQSFTALSNQLYTVTGTDVNGCTASDQVQVSLIQFDMLPMSDQTVCVGESAQFQTGNADSYTWSPLADLTFINDSTVTVNPSVSTVYKVVGQKSTCIDSVMVTLNILPSPNVNAGANAVVCVGDSVLLAASGAATYTWNGGLFTNGTYIHPTVSGYFVVEGSVGSCTAKDSLFLTVEPFPVVIFDRSGFDGCVPLTVSFSQSSINAAQYIWEFGDGSTSTAPNPMHTYNSSGYADVTLTIISANGCVATETEDSMIHVVDVPIAAFSTDLTSLSMDQSEVNFYNHSYFADHFLWNFGDASTSPDNNPTHTYEITNAESYMVELIAYASENCSDTAWVVLPIEPPLIFYVPNAFTPNGDKHNPKFKPVIYSGIDLTTYEFLIFNRWGQLVFEAESPDAGWDGSYKGVELVKQDIYTWKLSFKTKKQEDKVYTGFVTVIY